jgi:hypothetical protein
MFHRRGSKRHLDQRKKRQSPHYNLVTQNGQARLSSIGTATRQSGYAAGLQILSRLCRPIPCGAVNALTMLGHHRLEPNRNDMTGSKNSLIVLGRAWENTMAELTGRELLKKALAIAVLLIEHRSFPVLIRPSGQEGVAR